MVTDVSLKLTVQNVTLSFGKAYVHLFDECSKLKILIIEHKYRLCIWNLLEDIDYLIDLMEN